VASYDSVGNEPDKQWITIDDNPASPHYKACDILPGDQRTGRAAGVACAASGTADVVDAIVIVTAVRHQAPVVTSDPDDLTRIADSIGVKIRLFPT
jgi:predicted nucleic acid-binding protein